MKRSAFLLLVFLALAWRLAPAQSLSFEQPINPNEVSLSSHGKAEFRFALFPFTPAARERPRLLGFSLMPAASRSMLSTIGLSPLAAGPNLPVLGSGTLGRLTKWIGFTSSNSFIGDSTIFESKEGLVGIGTDSPTARLTVAGTIRSLSGGIQFPDGTVQVTAGIAPTQVVRSLNGLMGDLTLVPGANISITPGANTLTIAASGLLGAVAHDATLMGNGTPASPLGVAVPLFLTGSVPSVVISAVNDIGIGVQGRGGNMTNEPAGDGVVGYGGISDVRGGNGVIGHGGQGIGNSSVGGNGVIGSGGSSQLSEGGTGVVGFGGSSQEIRGGIGVRAFGGDSLHGFGGDGLFAKNGSGPLGAGLAGDFSGNVEIHGDLNVTGTKNFKIDHPLDPENKYLVHAAIESSEVLNVYSGNVVTDQSGEAVVRLPAWFEALNKDFRYQLTVIGTFAQAIVADEIRGNRFAIKTSAPGVKVSWQVTGVRSDAAMKRRAFQAEQEKPERERGTYVDPEAYGQPEERSLEWARHPDLMRRMKETREQAKRQQTSRGR